MTLTIHEIYLAARTAGFTPDQATTWTAIALAESGGDPSAHNPNGEDSRGLWQINLNAHDNKWGDLYDPVTNARAAYEISMQGTDMRPWTTTHASNAGTERDYRYYLDDVSEQTGYAGDDRGVVGYDSPLPEQLPPSQSTGSTLDPAQVTATTADPAAELRLEPDAQVDTDADGLTDAFERMIGSNLELADSDRDGLTDAYEAAISRSDVLRADTDADDVSDSTEVGLGTSPTTWDTDLDGASDGAELDYDKDPLVAETGTLPQPVPAVPPTATLTPTTPATTAVTTGETTAVTTGETVTGSPTVPVGTTETAVPSGGTLADAFVDFARAQAGDAYEYGTDVSLTDADPDTFDCSELTQWAAAQVGVTIGEASYLQYLELKDAGQTMTVEEALQTKGALLFYFSEEPTAGGDRPSQAHVAISLGDGRTIEAKGESYGVNEFPGAGRFNYAGTIPELSAELSATSAGTTALAVDEPAAETTTDPLPTDPDSDDDGLSDVFEQMVGLDPFDADTDADGRSDAAEQLGGRDLLSRQEVAAALAEKQLDGSSDADSDGLTNRYEIRHGLAPRKADTDSDDVSDSTEIALGTDGTLVDSDYDGVSDAFEIDSGTDPLLAGNPTDGWGASLDEGNPYPVSVGDDGSGAEDVVDLP